MRTVGRYIPVLYISHGSGAPWFVLPAILIIMGISVVASLIKGIGAATTGIAALKGLAGARQTVMGGSNASALALNGPIDLTGDGLATGFLSNPLLIQVATIMGAIQKCRQAGSNQIPTQLLTQRLAASWSTSVGPLPSGIFQMTEFHARPLTPTLVGARMLVWWKGRYNLGTPLTEYWTFTTSAPLTSLPAKCPNCGAPTAGSTTTGICAFCHTPLLSSQTPGSGPPPTWLVDDISLAPPAAAAA